MGTNVGENVGEMLEKKLWKKNKIFSENKTYTPDREGYIRRYLYVILEQIKAVFIFVFSLLLVMN